MLFAKKDIDQLNLKVRAGRALPDRFQGFLQRKNLLNEFGDAVIVDVDSQTEGYVLIEASKLTALQAEVKALRDKLEKRSK